jgi:hypothetical protein
MLNALGLTDMKGSIPDWFTIYADPTTPNQ